jgi:hypothetical protein
MQLPDKPVVRLIVMNNVFKLPKARHIELVEMYDLKVRCRAQQTHAIP